MTESILIQHLDGTTYNLDDLDIRVISFDPPSPGYQHTFTQIHQTKATQTASQIQQTTIPLVVQVRAHDVYDYELMRERVLRVFPGYESFYVINMRIPMIRWKVSVDGFSYPRLNNFWFTQPITINLMSEDGFAESVSMTSEDNFTKFDNKWGLGMNLPKDVDYSYKFTTNKFDVYNLGNIPLKAEERPVLYEFQGTVANGLTITNTTTDQTFKYNKGLKSSDKLQIYGMKPVLNNQLVFQDCNHAYLDLNVGKNTFIISGASGFTFSVATRFYY